MTPSGHMHLSLSLGQLPTRRAGFLDHTSLAHMRSMREVSARVLLPTFGTGHSWADPAGMTLAVSRPAPA